MPFASQTDLWVEGHDQFGARCWRHQISQETRYYHPPLQGLSTGTNPNVAGTAQFQPNTGSVAGAWVRYTDGNTGNPYWHNRITNLTTWHNPNGGF